MCLITKQRHALTAGTDIVVMKMVSKNPNSPRECESIMYGQRYAKGHVCHTELGVAKKRFNSYEDLHTFFRRKLQGAYPMDKGDIYTEVLKGFHSITNPELVKYSRRIVNVYFSLAEFIVPAKSLYYVNDIGEIVSNSIIFNKFLEYDEIII